MSPLLPLLVMCVWMILCVVTVIQNERLLKMFRERYPQLARQEIPWVFDNWSHPEKAIFFFRKRAIDILRTDPILWRERQRFVVLTIVTVGFWVTWGVVMYILHILSR